VQFLLRDNQKYGALSVEQEKQKGRGDCWILHTNTPSEHKVTSLKGGISNIQKPR
jgi:hypothetical protein